MSTQAITLHQFEQIDGLYSHLLRMGDFETCTDPREWIKISNRLYDSLIDALGYEAVDAFASAEECAADFVVRALLSATLVTDEVA